MGRRFAEFDWDAHPLGSPQGWPSEVRAAVATTLASRFPLALWLGTQDLFVVYNEAYIEILGDKHPAAWASLAGSVVGHLGLDRPDARRRGRHRRGNLVARPDAANGDRGWREDRYFTFTYSRLIAEDGQPYGIFCPSYETTERVLSERRLHLLNAVASAMMETRSIDDAVSVAVTVCAGQPADLPFIAVYVDDAETGEVTLHGATASVLPLLPRELAQLTDWHLASRSRAEVRLIDGVAAAIPGIEDVLGGDCPQQALVLPLGEASTVGALVVGTSPRRPLDTQYRGFCQLLADQLSSTFASIVSYEQERQRADALAELDRAKTADHVDTLRTPAGTRVTLQFDHAVATASATT